MYSCKYMAALKLWPSDSASPPGIIPPTESKVSMRSLHPGSQKPGSRCQKLGPSEQTPVWSYASNPVDTWYYVNDPQRHCIQWTKPSHKGTHVNWEKLGPWDLSVSDPKHFGQQLLRLYGLSLIPRGPRVMKLPQKEDRLELAKDRRRREVII